ncbi:hypothetical protein H4R24_001302 [Coemansia sp. RSA 988]|nr:hypothetical protein H4R24_001302 [Coemansia sp. RSA 988]
MTMWDAHLPLVEFVTNTRHHRDIGILPALVMFGHDMGSLEALTRPPAQSMLELTLANLANLCSNILHLEVMQQLSEYQSCMAKLFAANNFIKKFHIGNLILTQVPLRPPAGLLQFYNLFLVASISYGGMVTLKPMTSPDVL